MDKEVQHVVSTIRTGLSAMLDQLAGVTGPDKNVQPPVIQELKILQRHLEDGRMRTGVVQAYIMGADPWHDTPKGDESADAATAEEPASE